MQLHQNCLIRLNEHEMFHENKSVKTRYKVHQTDAISAPQRNLDTVYMQPKEKTIFYLSPTVIFFLNASLVWLPQTREQFLVIDIEYN